jgi:hypothetical protein
MPHYARDPATNCSTIAQLVERVTTRIEAPLLVCQGSTLLRHLWPHHCLQAAMHWWMLSDCLYSTLKVVQVTTLFSFLFFFGFFFFLFVLLFSVRAILNKINADVANYSKGSSLSLSLFPFCLVIFSESYS